MTKNGSVFNAPAPNSSNKTSSTSTKASTTSSNLDKLNDAQKSYEDIDKLKTTKDIRNAISDLENDMQSMNFIEKARARIKMKKLEEKKSDVAKQEYENSMNNLKSIASGKGSVDSKSSSSKTASPGSEGGHASVSEGKQMANDAKADQKSVKEGQAQTEKKYPADEYLVQKINKIEQRFEKI